MVSMITQSTIDLSWALLNADEVIFTQVNSALVFTGPHGRLQAVFSRIEAFLVRCPPYTTFSHSDFELGHRNGWSRD